MSVNLNKLVFRQEDKIGEGHFGEVYKVTDGTNYDKNKVVKVFRLPYLLSFIDKLTYGVSFDREVAALKYLGSKNISPKIVHVKNELTEISRNNKVISETRLTSSTSRRQEPRIDARLVYQQSPLCSHTSDVTIA